MSIRLDILIILDIPGNEQIYTTKKSIGLLPYYMLYYYMPAND